MRYWTNISNRSRAYIEHSDPGRYDCAGLYPGTMAFEIFYAICSRLVYCPDLQSTGKIFGKKTEAGAEA